MSAHPAIPAIPERPAWTASTEAARQAQRAWGARALRERLAILRRARHLLAGRGRALAESAASARHPVAEVLASEVLPLAAAMRFLERRAPGLLAVRRLGAAGRPVWIGRVAAEVRREPLGLIGIIGPVNYPLFLPGVQAVQALAAGNAVVVKPGEGGTAAIAALATVLAEAGLPRELLVVLPETAEAGAQLAALPCDKLIFTGSFATGTHVLSALAAHATPAVMELSGCDAVVVRADADARHVARALAFGLRLNGSRTCIAPRRVFVARELVEKLSAELAALVPADEIAGEGLAATLRPMLEEAVAAGGRFLIGGVQAAGAVALPCVVAGAGATVRLAREDVFAPVLSLIAVDSDAEALALAAACPYALGAAIFSADAAAAHELAGRLHAGSVCINDLILPTADPRVPFGGRGRSGFGATRGAEGLLEMTTLKVVHTRHGKFTPHFDAPRADDAAFFEECLRAGHAPGFLARAAALCRALKLLLTRSKRK